MLLTDHFRPIVRAYRSKDTRGEFVTRYKFLSMHIGIDGIPLATPKTGIGHYTFELAQGLAQELPQDEIQLITPVPVLQEEMTARAAVDAAEVDDAEEIVDAETSSVETINEPSQLLPPNLRTVQPKVSTLRKHWWTIGLPLHIRSSEPPVRLFHGTNYSIPLWDRCRTVVTIHDLSLLLHSSTHEAHLVKRARRRLPTMVRFATQIITDTEAVKKEICEHLDVRPEKVSVVPLAPRRVFHPIPPEETIETRRRLGVEDDFILFVGTVEPRKNLITLVRAFAELLRETELRPQLVVAGREGWLTEELHAYLKESAAGERVLFTGYISDEELRELYSSCRVCAYPSVYEGFGLPPLEAMACGAPVITSRIPVIMESVEQAARLIEPTDANALTRELIEMLTNEGVRRHFSEAGLKQAAQFTWERTARMTLDVYREIFARGWQPGVETTARMTEQFNEARVPRQPSL